MSASEPRPGGSGLHRPLPHGRSSDIGIRIASMPTLVNCPSCDRKLRVPDDMLGTRVKCPSCGGKFDAVADSDGAAPPPLPGASDQAPPALDELEEVPEGVQSKPAAPTRPARDDEDAVQDRPSRRQRWRDEDDDE